MLKLAVLAVGVWISFVAFGWAQETLTSHEFGEAKERFEHTSSLVLLQSVGNAIIAYLALLLTYGPGVSITGGVPTKDWLIAALGYLGAHKFGLEALRYIIFPLQVVVKSCKAIPVMAGEMLIAKVQHPLSKKLSVLIMTLGVIAFTLAAPSKKGSQAFVLDRKTVIGLTLVFLALVCDGIYGPYQNKIAKEFKVSEFHLMLNMNLWQGLFSFLIIAPSGAPARRAPSTRAARMLSEWQLCQSGSSPFAP
jgi:UDP-galactose transporter B1